MSVEKQDRSRNSYEKDSCCWCLCLIDAELYGDDAEQDSTWVSTFFFISAVITVATCKYILLCNKFVSYLPSKVSGKN